MVSLMAFYFLDVNSRSEHRILTPKSIPAEKKRLPLTRELSSVSETEGEISYPSVTYGDSSPWSRGAISLYGEPHFVDTTN